MTGLSALISAVLAVTLQAATDVEQHADTIGRADVWRQVADCETGDRLPDGTFIKGTARWWWADPNRQHPPWGTHVHEGGLQFLPSTWTWAAPNVLQRAPERAWQASVSQQIAVAEWVLDKQGWQAWPDCSQRLGLR